MKSRAKIKFVNNEKDPLNMLLEPWADEIVLSEGETAYLTAEGAEPGELEIHSSTNSIVVYGWPGSICELIKVPVG